MNSAIAILTYRRSHAVKAFLASILEKCPGYRLAIFEDNGNADDTVDFLASGGTFKGVDGELESDIWEFPNYTVYIGRRNLGVAGNSNRAIKWFMRGQEQHLCLCNDDLIAKGDFVKAYFESHRILKVGLWCFCPFNDEHYRSADIRVKGRVVRMLPRKTGIMMSMTRTLIEKIGYFDVYSSKFGNEHSLPTGSLVLGSDYSWKPIEQFAVGDEVIGWTRRESQSKKYAGKTKSTGAGFWNSLVKTTVLKTHSYVSDTVELTLLSGKVVVCTPDHFWFNGGKSYKEATKIKALKKIYNSEPSTLTDSEEYCRGYVAGAIFGDGSVNEYSAVLRVTSNEFITRYVSCLDRIGAKYSFKILEYPVKTTGNIFTGEYRKMFCVVTRIKSVVAPTTDAGWKGWLGGMYDAEGNGSAIAQSAEANPAKCDIIGKTLTRFGFKYNQHTNQFNILGGRRELVRFINLVRPACTSKADRIVLNGLETVSDPVVSVKPGRRRKVHCLTTDSGNYVAEGYASHNCDFNIRATLSGFLDINGQPQHCLDIQCAELVHQPIQSSIYPFERPKFDKEADEAFAMMAQRHSCTGHYRPFKLYHGKYAGGYDGAGIPTFDLERLGYEMVVDYDLHDSACLG